MQDSESSTKEQICSSIFSLPLQLCAEDIEDFFSLANYYASRTPQSFRKVRACSTHVPMLLYSFVISATYAHFNLTV